MEDDSNEEYVERILDWSQSPSGQAALEQAQAQFIDDLYVLMTFTHAAALAALRQNTYMQAVASQQVSAFIAGLDEQQVRILMMKLAGAVLTMESELRHDGDMEAAIATIGGPKDFMRLESYIATNGDLCLFCGESTVINNDGIAHHCKADKDDLS